MGNYQSLWKIPIVNSTQIDDVSSIIKHHTFNIDQIVCENQQNLRLQFKKNTLEGFTVRLGYDPTPVDIHVGVIYAAAILLIFYILLIYEVANSYSNKLIFFFLQIDFLRFVFLDCSSNICSNYHISYCHGNIIYA